METIENKLKELRNMLLNKDYPLDIDEILGQIEYLFENDKEISKVIDGYVKNYYTMFYCAQKFYKVKDLVDEQFYSEEDEDNTYLTKHWLYKN